MAWVPGHDIHQGKGLMAGSGTRRALSRKQEPQCCVHRCRWLFGSSEVPMSCPQAATSSQKWGRLWSFATILAAQELPAIPPSLPAPPDQLPAFNMSHQPSLQQAHTRAGTFFSFPQASHGAGSNGRAAPASCCLEPGHTTHGAQLQSCPPALFGDCPPAWLPLALPLQSEALQQLPWVFPPGHASQLHHPFVLCCPLCGFQKGKPLKRGYL